MGGGGGLGAGVAITGVLVGAVAGAGAVDRAVASGVVLMMRAAAGGGAGRVGTMAGVAEGDSARDGCAVGASEVGAGEVSPQATSIRQANTTAAATGRRGRKLWIPFMPTYHVQGHGQYITANRETRHAPRRSGAIAARL